MNLNKCLTELISGTNLLCITFIFNIHNGIIYDEKEKTCQWMQKWEYQPKSSALLTIILTNMWK